MQTLGHQAIGSLGHPRGLSEFCILHSEFSASWKPSAIIDILQPLVPGAAYEPGRSVDFATIYVPADRLVETCLALRDTRHSSSTC